MRLRPIIGAPFVLLAVLTARPAAGCGFIDSVANAVTLREEVKSARIVAFGAIANPHKAADGTSSTDFHVTRVLKSPPSFDSKRVIQLPHNLPVKDPRKPPTFIVFFDDKEGALDPYRGLLAGPALFDYLKGLQALGDRDRTRLLRYCFDFLDHPVREVAADAFLEFMKTTDRELGAAGRTLPAEKLRVWIKDAKTPPDRLRMYGFLLGCCGKDRDADLLRTVIDKQVAAPEPKLFDGVLTGYVLLRPREGWALVRQLMAKASNHFQVRYSALRVVRFFHNSRPDVIGMADVLDALRLALPQDDMADLAINYLAQWRCWDLTDRILPLYGKTSHDAPFMRRAIVRYALQCPRPAAAQVVARARKADAEMVSDLEELLRQESRP